ncbi:glycosyltransferase [Vibrio tetraodonis]|uniref:glycosyltransferase n=1 Tax=Vibrio tetraodonis TaxID=2231647 RepID=UPI000E0BBE25|nr:glycosyltransferase [Vibrio tetraodonis]
MDSSKTAARSLLDQSNTHFDLTNPEHQVSLLSLADKLLCFEDMPLSDLLQISENYDAPLEFELAVKLVQSRREILSITQPASIAVVFAMWGEHNRLLAKDEENPNGEDSLRTKIAQLEWITRDSLVDWHLYAVDDGCPHESADIAQRIVDGLDEHLSKRVSVLELSKALPTTQGPLRNLTSADDSRKGGAIIYGCMQALNDGADAVVYTDADNSVHLGQLGTIVGPFCKHAKQVVLGNRKHPDSILVKQEERWGVGIKTLRHMQRMIGAQIFDNGIKDTQAAFKLYGREVLSKILQNPTVFDFSFDTDWIYAAMELKQSIATVPFAFIDSAAESASIVQGPMTTWYVLIEGLVKAAEARNAEYSEEMANVFKSEIKSYHDLELIIDVLPPELADAEDKELGNPTIMSPNSVRQWIKEAKESNEQATA